MTGIDAMDIARDSVITLLWIAGPITLVGVLVGLTISFIQALTQVQEMTLALFPKIIVMFICLMMTLPFMADAIQSYMMRLTVRLIAGY
jgi:flagellar biosynthetic protein FliQ